MILFAVGFVAGGAVVGALVWWACWWRSETRLMDLGRLEERADAYRRADTRTDLDVVGPVTPPEAQRPVRPVRLYDQDSEPAELTR